MFYFLFQVSILSLKLIFNLALELEFCGAGGRRQVAEVVLRVDQEQVECRHDAPRDHKMQTR